MQSQTVAELLGLPDPRQLPEAELHARITQLLRHIELVFSPDQLHIDTAGQVWLARAFGRFAESLRFQLLLS
ncbi:hypothetical protein [Chitinilyticum piscinae]|uniref:Uncharacterized protein n=1 Tax=Chitinilyticum piscinae TaxID=2866724 RepID=A0A8J7FIS2_9NEIS|nr:hypothetical protein [Chitinilyticum piscinae]MBE9608567.1 hypothetical protein [Chitinilyticum piscinae]